MFATELQTKGTNSLHTKTKKNVYEILCLCCFFLYFPVTRLHAVSYVDTVTDSLKIYKAMNVKFLFVLMSPYVSYAYAMHI